jgi:hypothetical protein
MVVNCRPSEGRSPSEKPTTSGRLIRAGGLASDKWRVFGFNKSAQLELSVQRSRGLISSFVRQIFWRCLLDHEIDTLCPHKHSFHFETPNGGKVKRNSH